jgi:hypothetical protein
LTPSPALLVAKQEIAIASTPSPYWFGLHLQGHIEAGALIGRRYHTRILPRSLLAKLG